MQTLHVSAAESAAELFDSAYYAAGLRARAYTADLLFETLVQMGAGPVLAAGIDAETLASAIGCVPGQVPLVDWALRYLADQGRLTSGQSPVLRLCLGEHAQRPALSDPDGDPFSAEGAPLVRHAAAAWPAVLRGEANGMRMLFKGEGLQFWERYFSPAHRLYDVHNQWGARVVADLTEPGERVLELGAGFGSAARAVIAALREAGKAPGEYVATDVNLLLARRAESALRKEAGELPVRSTAIDFNRNLEEQGIADGSFDVIYACNALHCARDMVYSLENIRRALCPGGRLILSECVRESTAATLHQELIFLLLDSYREVLLDPVTRPVPGFLLPENWEDLLRQAGYQEVRVVTNQQGASDPMLGAVVWGTAP